MGYLFAQVRSAGTRLCHAKTQECHATQQITIATTPQVVKILTRLAEQGLHGKNIAEVAERLLSERLREFVEQRKSPRGIGGYPQAGKSG